VKEVAMKPNLWKERREKFSENLSLVLAIMFIGVGIINTFFPQWLQSQISGLLLTALGVLITVAIWDRRIDRERHRQTEDSLNRLEPSISMAQSAFAADIVRLFPERNDEKAQNAIRELLQDTETKQVSIAAIALPSLFHLGHIYTEIVRRNLERGVKFRVVLLNPRGTAADQRAARELATATVQDIERSTRSIQEYIDSNLPIEARLYDFPPQLYMIQTDSAVFFESYHFGRVLSSLGDQPLHGCIGGQVPCYLAKKNPGRELRNGVWDILSDHFDYLWSGTYPDGQAITLPIYSALKIDNYDHSERAITLTNYHRFISINLAGWSVQATRIDGTKRYSEKIKIFEFSEDQTIKPREHLTIKFEKELGLDPSQSNFLEEFWAAPQGTYIELMNRRDALAARLPNDGFVLDL
jgi:hypothetical protein